MIVYEATSDDPKKCVALQSWKELFVIKVASPYEHIFKGWLFSFLYIKSGLSDGGVGVLLGLHSYYVLFLLYPFVLLYEKWYYWAKVLWFRGYLPRLHGGEVIPFYWPFLVRLKKLDKTS